MMSTTKASVWELQDLRNLPYGLYFTQCTQCGWKGQQTGGSSASVCPHCAEPLYALGCPRVVIPAIHRAGNELIRDVYEHSHNPYTSPEKIRRGFEMAAMMEVDPERGDTVETLHKKVADARKDAEQEIKKRF